MSRLGFVVFAIFSMRATCAFSDPSQWDSQSINNVHGKQYRKLLEQNDKAEYHIDWRLAITKSTQSFIYRVDNVGNSSLVIPSESKIFPHLHDAFRKHYGLFLTGNDSGREVPTRDHFAWRRSVDFVLSAVNYGVLSGNLARARWRLMSKWAPPIWIAFPDENGRIEHVNSLSEEKSIHLILASVYNKAGLEEIACILINQTDSSISPERIQGLNQIRINALDISKEYQIQMSQHIDPNIEVAAGEHHIWPLPWSAVLNAIDESDVEGVRETGVRIDLAWHIGGHKSTLLPMVIMPPTKRESEQ